MTLDWQEALKKLELLTQKPPLFESGEQTFWDDPHISKQLLKAHLDPETDLASRKHTTINKEVEHLFKSGILKPNNQVLDLGCGPGLYSSRLAGRGLNVTGIDMSANSLEYAKRQAEATGQIIEYMQMDFFDIDFKEQFDAILQTNGELNTFSNAQRDRLLKKLWLALKPDGVLIFDVTTGNLRQKHKLQNGWFFVNSGFWRLTPHLVLEQGYDYPEADVFLNRHIVLDEEKLTDYRFWFHDYNLETLKPVLQKAGFKITHVWNDLTGAKYQAGGDWLAVVAKKVVGSPK